MNRREPVNVYSPGERIRELLDRADREKWRGHARLVEGDWQGALDAYEEAFRSYEELTTLREDELYEQKKKQVLEWQMDVRNRITTEEDRRIQEERRARAGAPGQ